MPPKVTDTRSPAEPLHAVEEETAAAARKVVASYAENFFDGVTLMCMLGMSALNQDVVIIGIFIIIRFMRSMRIL